MSRLDIGEELGLNPRGLELPDGLGQGIEVFRYLRSKQRINGSAKLFFSERLS
jgi:hypothetical protein